MFQQVSVWLDELAPERGAFAYAREWAARLNRPLNALLPSGGWTKKERLTGAKEMAGPGDLCVLGHALAADRGAEPLRRSVRREELPLLVCPDDWSAVSRVLVLHEGARADRRFLHGAVGLSLALDARPVILSVALSERGASQRREEAEAVLGRQAAACDFDVLAGLGARRAVAAIAGWRRCQLVVLKWPAAPWWRPWQGRWTLGRLAVAARLPLLALPEGIDVLRDEGPAEVARLEGTL
jgi:hypothetical protein